MRSISLKLITTKEHNSPDLGSKIGSFVCLSTLQYSTNDDIFDYIIDYDKKS